MMASLTGSVCRNGKVGVWFEPERVGRLCILTYIALHCQYCNNPSAETWVGESTQVILLIDDG